MASDRLICFFGDIHLGVLDPEDPLPGPVILQKKLGAFPDGAPVYQYIYDAAYTTLGVCLLLDIKPRELLERALLLGWIYWDPVRGLQPTPMDPETCFHPVDFFYEADPDEPEKHARYKRTIADAYWTPESLDYLGLKPDGGKEKP